MVKFYKVLFPLALSLISSVSTANTRLATDKLAATTENFVTEQIINCIPLEENTKFIDGFNYTIKETRKRVFLQHNFTGEWLPCGDRVIKDEVYYAMCDRFDYPYRGESLYFLHDEFVCKVIN